MLIKMMHKYIFTTLKVCIKKVEGWKYNLVIEHMLSMREVLHSGTSTLKRKKGKEREGEWMEGEEGGGKKKEISKVNRLSFHLRK
jgi:hypothetical protein